MEPVTTNITVEVHCRRPPWSIDHWDRRYRDSRYRIYIDNDLITERTWIWNNTTYVKEHLWANLSFLGAHSIRLEPVIHIPEQAKFGLLEFNVIDTPIKVLGIKAHEITFKLV
jgi:hypothetical protein